VRDGRFRPSYQPAGSATGRWSSNGGGALSIPAQVRSAAVADEGWLLVVADVAQLEPRVLAGMSGDRRLAGAARGADLYQGMVDDGAVATRRDAKIGLIGAMYGATSGESGRLVAGLMRRYPDAFGLVEAAARAGERGQVVRTLLGRGSPTIGDAFDHDLDDPPDDPDRIASRRRAFGRFTRNFVVQGTGAEWALCWVADLRNRLWRLGGGGPLASRPHLVFFLHDEVVVHTPAALAGAVAEQVAASAAAAGRLLFGDMPIDFPLNVSVVRSYAEAGKPGAVTEPVSGT
jgi:DNA polymerase-1